MIVVYSTPNCVNCNALKKNYKAHQIEFEEKTIGVDITKEDLEELTGVALRSAPVIVNNDTYVGGIAEGLGLMNDILAERTEIAKKQMEKELQSLGISL